MSEPTRLAVKVSVGSQGHRPSVSKMVTLESVTRWIKEQELDEYTEKGLIGLAGGYPTAALPSFRRNINLMIQRVRAKRTKDTQGDDQDGYEHEEVKAAVNAPASLDEAFRLLKKGTEEPVEAKYDPFADGSPVRLSVKIDGRPQGDEEEFEGIDEFEGAEAFHGAERLEGTPGEEDSIPG